MTSEFHTPHEQQLKAVFPSVSGKQRKDIFLDERFYESKMFRFRVINRRSEFPRSLLALRSPACSITEEKQSKCLDLLETVVLASSRTYEANHVC